jgi:hypothetical protein
LPSTVYDEVEKAAQARNTTVVDLLRRFIKIGLLVINLDESPDSALIIREGNTERQVMLI